MLGNRGADAWESIKWIPRFIMITLCLVLIIYIFSVMIDVNYDAPAIKSTTALAVFSYSDAFAHEDDPSAIDLERFTTSSLESVYPFDVEEEEPGDEPIVEELVFAPISARLTLTSLDGSFDEREVFYAQESFERLVELYVSGSGSTNYARSENLVRVYDPAHPAEPMLAQLTVEVIV